MAAERPRYERFLSFLGTLGSNAPFIGLFGTVLGIIKAFNDLGAVAIQGSAIQQTVMTGISEALVATAVGLAVAIPAVVALQPLHPGAEEPADRAHQALGTRWSPRPGAGRSRGAGDPRGARRGRGLSAVAATLGVRTTTRRSPGSTSPRWSTSCWCC